MAKDKSRLNWRGEGGVQLKMDWRDHLTSHVMGIQSLNWLSSSHPYYLACDQLLFVARSRTCNVSIYQTMANGFWSATMTSQHWSRKCGKFLFPVSCLGQAVSVVCGLLRIH